MTNLLLGANLDPKPASSTDERNGGNESPKTSFIEHSYGGFWRETPCHCGLLQCMFITQASRTVLNGVRPVMSYLRPSWPGYSANFRA